jgi:hypothetical protein
MEGEYLYTALCGRRMSSHCAVWKENILTLRCMEGGYLYTAQCGRRISLHCAVWKENILTLRCMEGEYLYTALYETIMPYTEWFGK